MEDNRVTASYRLFVLDLDGTIADSTDCVVASFTATLARHQMSAVDRDAIIHRMGLPLPQVFRELTNNGYSNAHYDQLATDYRSTYRDLLPHKTRAFPGVNAALKYLTDNHAVCTIATSKSTELALASAQHLELDGYFSFCIGDDRVTHSKPHPDMLERSLAKSGISAVHAVMVGDAVTDIQMGQAAGMDTIAVTWGAHPVDVLTAASPTHLIDTADGLTRFV
jgi:phosphoglycolate phosphatase/pyrophosphatase PpaX